MNVTPDYKPAKTIGLSRTDYTNDQKTAISKILDWAVNSDKEPFTLSGFAGSGKTTVFKDIVRNLSGTMAITAPTHKAVRIVSNTVGVEGSTIHKILGLRPNVDLNNFDVNNPQFDPIGTPWIKNYKYILIDECSFINKYLYGRILEESKKYNVKILLAGDPFQLPPVKEDYSVAFRGKNQFNLNEIVRQDKDNKLIDLLTIARNDVKNNTNNLVRLLSKANDMYDSDADNGYVIADGTGFIHILNDRFNSAEFERDIDHCRYTAFTNRAILDMNGYVRNLVVGSYDNILVQDDILTSYSTVLDEFNTPIIVNSEDYIIHELSDYNNKYSLSGYLTTLKAVSDGKLTNSIFIVNHKNIDSLNRYVAVYKLLLNAAASCKTFKRRELWEKFYDFKNHNLLLVDIIENGRKLATKDLDYAFGLTVHKTQGSTFKNIFINSKDIIYNEKGIPYSNMNLRNRLLYVALSRAQNSAFILI